MTKPVLLDLRNRNPPPSPVSKCIPRLGRLKHQRLTCISPRLTEKPQLTPTSIVPNLSDIVYHSWLHIFPCEPEAGPKTGKRPVEVKKGTRFAHSKNSSSDPGQIQKWAEKYPDCNWGIVTGKRNRCFGIDVDMYKDGVPERLKELQAAGILPEHPNVDTGGGGLHFYFDNSEGRAFSKDAQQALRGILKEGIDFKANSAYLIAPGSRHESGRIYEFDKDGPGMKLQPVSDALVALICKPKPSRTSPAAGCQPECVNNVNKLIVYSLPPSINNIVHTLVNWELTTTEIRELENWVDWIFKGDFETAQKFAGRCYQRDIDPNHVAPLAKVISTAAVAEGRWHVKDEPSKFAYIADKYHRYYIELNLPGRGDWAVGAAMPITFRMGFINAVKKLPVGDRSIIFINYHNAKLRERIAGDGRVEIPLGKQADYFARHVGGKPHGTTASRIRKRLLIDTGIMPEDTKSKNYVVGVRSYSYEWHTPPEWREGPEISQAETEELLGLIPLNRDVLKGLNTEFEPIPGHPVVDKPQLDADEVLTLDALPAPNWFSVQGKRDTRGFLLGRSRFKLFPLMGQFEPP